MNHLKDILNILSHLNFYRSWNLVILRVSFYYGKIVKRPIHFGQPFTLSIEPTTACNLACPECPSGLKQFTRPTGKLNIELHEKMLQQVHKSVFYINYYFQGEPFLNPKFLSIIRQAKQYNIYTATSTNAHFIDQKKSGGNCGFRFRPIDYFH